MRDETRREERIRDGRNGGWGGGGGEIAYICREMVGWWGEMSGQVGS